MQQRTALMTGDYACTTRQEKPLSHEHAVDTSAVLPFPSTAAATATVTSTSTRTLVTATSTRDIHAHVSTDVTTRVLNALISAMIDVPLSAGTHELHVEMVTTMLVSRGGGGCVQRGCIVLTSG